MAKKEHVKIDDIEFYYVKQIDGAKGIDLLADKSVKLFYGSPPYPNARRNYGNWSEKEYINKIAPFIDAAIPKLRDDGFIVINVKANRTQGKNGQSSRRSLVIERLAIALEERWHLYCVDIEIWVKTNPVPTGVKVACQDAYEQNLWFSKSPTWSINIDAIRKPYKATSLKTYNNLEYHPRQNGLGYVTKSKKIDPNPLGALPQNVISGAVATNNTGHQAVQPEYIAEKYIKAVTNDGDIVVDPWMGSGTTGVVAVRLGRKFIGFDIMDEYVNISKDRIKLVVQNGKTSN